MGTKTKQPHRSLFLNTEFAESGGAKIRAEAITNTYYQAIAIKHQTKLCRTKLSTAANRVETIDYTFANKAME